MTECELFLSALDIDDRSARQAHLQAASDGDSRLLSRVEAMLKAAEEDSDFLATPVMEQLGATGIVELDASLIRDPVPQSPVNGLRKRRPWKSRARAPPPISPPP